LWSSRLEGIARGAFVIYYGQLRRLFTALADLVQLTGDHFRRRDLYSQAFLDITGDRVPRHCVTQFP
jgi:hypothetical protein